MRVIPYIFFVASIVTLLPASASPTSCISVDNDLDRLACYDKEMGRTTKVEIISPSKDASTVDVGKLFPQKNSWQVQKETSKLTDDTNIFLTVLSDDPVNCGWNRNDLIRLTLRCMENTTSLILNTDCHMTSSDYSDYGHVTYRLDDTKAKTARMRESTDNKALGLWSGGSAIPVIKQMLGKSQMVVRATPYGESSFTATFDIAGLETAIIPLREECGW